MTHSPRYSIEVKVLEVQGRELMNAYCFLLLFFHVCLPSFLSPSGNCQDFHLTCTVKLINCPQDSCVGLVRWLRNIYHEAGTVLSPGNSRCMFKKWGRAENVAHGRAFSTHKPRHGIKWVWWSISLNSNTWGVEAGGSKGQGHTGQHTEPGGS